MKAKKNPETCGACGDPMAGHPEPRRACRYNGWSNYETWCVKLWLDNEEASHRFWREATRGIRRETRAGQYPWQTREYETRKRLSDLLKSEHQDQQPEINGVFADLLNTAMGEVDWDEIAEAMLAEVQP